MKSLSDKVKMQSAVSLAIGTITVSIVVAILAMFFITTMQLSTLNGSVVALDTRIGGLETKVVSLDDRVAGLETKVASLDDRVAGLETKVASLDEKVASLDEKVTTAIQ